MFQRTAFLFSSPKHYQSSSAVTDARFRTMRILRIIFFPRETIKFVGSPASFPLSQKTAGKDATNRKRFVLEFYSSFPDYLLLAAFFFFVDHERGNLPRLGWRRPVTYGRSPNAVFPRDPFGNSRCILLADRSALRSSSSTRGLDLRDSTVR